MQEPAAQELSEGSIARLDAHLDALQAKASQRLLEQVLASTETALFGLRACCTHAFSLIGCHGAPATAPLLLQPLRHAAHLLLSDEPSCRACHFFSTGPRVMWSNLCARMASVLCNHVACYGGGDCVAKRLL